MTMRKVFVISIVMMISATLYSQGILGFGERKIKKLEVKEDGFKIEMNFSPVIDEIENNGILYKISPLSPDEPNSKFIYESLLNGQLSYSGFQSSRHSYFQKKQKRKRKREKSDFDFFLEGAFFLVDRGMIDNKEFDELSKQILYHFDFETADEKYSIDRLIVANPYYVYEKYLSLFKLEITNPTNRVFLFDKQIFIQSGNTALRPLSNDVIVDLLQNSNLINLYKLLTLERHNLNDIIVVPPRAKVEKYFAAVPIDFKNSTLEISFVGIENRFQWNIEKEEVKIDELFTYFEFYIDRSYPGFISYGDVELEFMFLSDNPNSIYLGDSELFIGELDLSKQFNILSLSLQGDELYFGKSENINGNEYLEKNMTRRKPIPISLKKIEGLEKKVKN